MCDPVLSPSTARLVRKPAARYPGNIQLETAADSPPHLHSALATDYYFAGKGSYAPLIAQGEACLIGHPIFRDSELAAT
jgi:hypothetical protein